jgi:2-polyprenyl-6-methoxyphenol hydroxylase-like FAD-dependent oxidoreductase
MQDAVILANCLYEIAKNPTSDNIADAFRDYQEQRFPHVQQQFDVSKTMAKVIYGQVIMVFRYT